MLAEVKRETSYVCRAPKIPEMIFPCPHGGDKCCFSCTRLAICRADNSACARADKDHCLNRVEVTAWTHQVS